MVEAVVRDKRRLVPCAVLCEKEYGVGGYCVGVPVVLGNGGMRRIIEIDMNEQERKEFQNSVDAVRSLVEAMAKLVG